MEKLIKNINESFNDYKNKANTEDIYSIKVVIGKMDYNKLAMELIHEGYSVLLMKEDLLADDMTLTVYKKYS